MVKEQRQLLVAQSGSRAEPEAPFLDHDTALFVDFFRREGQPGRGIRQRRQRLVEDLGLVGRHVEHVDRFVEARIGVQVWTESGAVAFEVFHELAGREVRAPVERHVLDQVREALLIGLFHQRSGFDGESQRHALGRPCIHAHVILQPVRQRGGLDRGVERNGVVEVESRRLCDDGGRRGRDECKHRQRATRTCLHG